MFYDIDAFLKAPVSSEAEVIMETNDVLGTLAILLSVLILIYLVWGNGKTPENLDEQTKRSKKKGRTV